MVCQHPKFRSDLVVRQRAESGPESYVIKDPLRDRYFHFREPEVFLARQMDGVTPRDTIRRRVEERFASPLTSKTLEHFVEKLDGLGLLEGNGTAPAASEPQRRRVRGSLLYLRFKMFDPDALLSRLVGKVQWFFTPQFVVLAAGLMLLAAVVSITSRDAMTGSFLNLYRLDMLILA